MTTERIRTYLQGGLLLMTVLGVLGGAGIWTINTLVAQEVGPVKVQMMTLEGKVEDFGGALAAVQADVKRIDKNLVLVQRDVKWIMTTLEEIKGAVVMREAK